MAKFRFLNLGCGNDYRESTDEFDWVNVDRGMCRADIHIDIEHASEYPDWGVFDHIEAIQVLEHINKDSFGDVIKWMYDISHDGTTWYIAVPHGLSENFITDPTHKTPFSVRTFDYFIENTDLRHLGVIYGWDRVKLLYVNQPYLDINNTIVFTFLVKK